MAIKKRTAAFDSAQLGTTSSLKLDIFSRLLDGVMVKVVGSGASGAEIDAADVIENIVLKQDTKQKLLIKPALQRKLDNILNGSSDSLSPSSVFIPFTRLGVPESAWGTADIGELMLQATLKATLPANNTFTRLEAFAAHRPIAQPVPRGDVFVQTVVPVTGVVGGWNQINDLPYQDIIALTKMILAHNAITEVEIYLGDDMKYQLTKDAASFALQMNPLYKRPSTLDFFPVVFDDIGSPSDYLQVIVGGVRRPVVVRFYWDTNVAAAAPFEILAEGIERGTPRPVAASKA